jgi:hypothetical protein
MIHLSCYSSGRMKSFESFLTIKSLRVIAIWVLGLVSVPGFSQTTNAPAESLLKYFSSTCASQGAWTQSALNSARALAESLKILENDPACATFSQSLSEVSLVDQRLQSLGPDQNFRSITQLKSAQKELYFQLGEPMTADESVAVRNQLRAVQLELAKLETVNPTDKEYAETKKKGEALKQLVFSVNKLNEQAISSQDCMEKNPKLLKDLAYLSGSVGAMIATNGVSLGIAAATDLMSTILESARKNKIAKRISSLSSELTLAAYQCTLESLSNQWCDANDALRLVELNQRLLEKKQPRTLFEQSVILIQRDVPKFIGWLELVRSGAEPTNQAAADRQAQVIDKESNVKTVRISALAAYAEAKPIFDELAGKFEQQWAIERSLIQKTTAIFYRGNNSPGAALYPLTYFPYFLMGLLQSEVPKDDAGNVISFESILDPVKEIPGFKLSLETVRRRVLEAISQAQETVAKEMNLILQPDILGLIVEASMEDQDGRSALKSAVRLRDYLRNQLVVQREMFQLDGSARRLTEETIGRLSKIIEQIESVRDSAPTPEPVAPTKELGIIYKQAELDNGTILLQGRLERAIRLALNRLLTSGTAGIDVDAQSLLLASADVMKEVQSYSGKQNLYDIRVDLEKAKGITENTLSAFVSVFNRGIAAKVEALAQPSVTPTSVSGSRVKRRELSELCLKLLSAPVWPEKVPLSACFGAKLVSGWERGPQSLEFKAGTISLPYETRACAFRNFSRGTWIYQRGLERARTD